MGSGGWRVQTAGDGAGSELKLPMRKHANTRQRRKRKTVTARGKGNCQFDTRNADSADRAHHVAGACLSAFPRRRLPMWHPQAMPGPARHPDRTRRDTPPSSRSIPTNRSMRHEALLNLNVDFCKSAYARCHPVASPSSSWLNHR